MVEGQMYSKLTTSGNRIFPLPPEPKRTGYIFQGWFYDEDIYLEPFDNTAWENAPLATNITIYAKWKREGACPEGECVPGKFSLVKEPTCTEKGVEQATCKECSEIVSRYIAMIDHTPADEKVIENEVVATCDKEGSYDEVTVCSVCAGELERQTISTEKLSHIPKEAVKEKYNDSTCVEEGSYESAVYCRDCGEELSREVCTIERKPHDQKNNVCSVCEVDFLTYEYSEELDGYVVTGGEQNTYSTIVIPSKYNGVAVRAIGEGAFANFHQLKKIEIPFNVTLIQVNAFSGCTSLNNITYKGKIVEWKAIEIAEGNDLLKAISPYCTNNFTDMMPL